MLLFVISLCCAAIVYVACRKCFDSRRRRSEIALLRGPPSPSFLKGHIGQLYDRKCGLEFHEHLAQDFDGIAKVKGFLGDDQIYVSDTVALQAIIVKDQESYDETKVFIENNKIIFGEGLVASTGELHRKQRRLVTPAFSLHRLKRLVPVFQAVADRLRDALLAEIHDAKVTRNEEQTARWTTDISEWLTRAALESIGMAGLGYSLDPLNSPSMNPYTRAVRSLIPTMFSIAPLRLLTPFVTRLGPPQFRRFLLNLVPIPAVQQLKFMSDQMDLTCREVLHKKRHPRLSDAVASGGPATFAETERWATLAGVGDDMVAEDGYRYGRDIMSILLKANEGAGRDEKLSDAELLGQMNVLIFGAQDTTSSALSRVMYLLSRPENEKLQQTVRDEIGGIRDAHGIGSLTFEDLEKLPVLDAILKETLRLYPPVPFVRRTATRATALPFSRSIQLTDGSHVDCMAVPKGTTVWVSISAANRSPDIWGPDADEWKPMRWLEHADNQGEEQWRSKDYAYVGKLKIPGIYSGMLTFFAGGRSCVGYRFALIEMKIILMTLISTFSFSATEDHIVWNLSQIVSPSFKRPDGDSDQDIQGLPVLLKPCDPLIS